MEELTALPAETEDKAPGLRPDPATALPQGPSEVVPLPAVQGPAVEPDGCYGGGGMGQEGAPQEGIRSHPGEWKLVTILCAASVTRSAGETRHDADARYRQLSRLYALAHPVVQRYEGTLQPVMGDHVLAVFGAPVAQEDHAQRAVLAALELQRRVREASVDGKAQQLDSLGVHIGLSTGQVAVGGIGDPTAGLAVVGETVTRALALQAQAAPGAVLCSDATAYLVRGVVRIAAVAPVPMAGEPTPVAAYTVLGPHRRRPFRALAPRVWAPFVGRRHELATLRTLLAQVEEGRGQVVGMIGEPGVGKSRLCYEFLCGSPSHPWMILETQATAYGQATPYLPLIGLLKDYFHIDAADDLPSIREKVTAALHRLDKTLTSTAPAFLTLLDVPVEDPTWQVLEASQRRQRTLEALKRILLRKSQVHPLLLVVENLHWIDAETQAVLDTLVESLPAARLFLLTTYRPEYRHAWGSKTSYTQLRLDPLTRDSAGVLLDALVGDDPSLRSLKTRVIERTEGNPFFVEESVQMLVETRVLVGERGTYRLAQVTPTLQVPATVQAVLAARIDRLPPEEKRLLQAAAVIGREVPFPLIQGIAEMPEGNLHRGLAHLQAAEFLYEANLFPDLVYTFRHALTQEVAYSSLLPERRHALHRQIVEALEALYPDCLPESVERLAQHALRGEAWEKDLDYCLEAGKRAKGRGAVREAVTYYEQAVGALGHLPECPDTAALAVELHHLFGGVLSLVGAHERSLTVLGEAAARARRLGDRAWLGRALCRSVTVRQIIGDVDGALAAGREALGLAASLGDPALHVHASYRMGQTFDRMGDYGRAAALLRGNVAALAQSTPGVMRIHCIKSQAYLPRVLGLLGEFAEGRCHGEEALRLAVTDGQWQGDAPATARAHLGELYLAQGDLDAAIRVLEEGLALCRTSDNQAVFGYTAGGLGEAYARTGRLAEGLALLEEARRSDLRTGALGGGYVTRLRQLSVVYLLAGRLNEAERHARQALDLARELKGRGDEARALFQLGAVHAHASPPDVLPAEACYREALTLAETLGMRPLQAHCYHGLGTLYAMLGQREQACAELSAAIELYRAMDMTLWLLQAEATLAHIGGGGVLGELHAVSEAPHVGENWTRWMPPGAAGNRHGA